MNKYLLAFLLVTLPAYADWSKAIDDLPLMPGMHETGAPLIFDKPGGRIIETDARTSAKADAVHAFYDKALPPLGWQGSGGRYARGRETLTIDIKDGAVHFTLAPKE